VLPAWGQVKQEVAVAKTIACRHGGIVCGARVTGETEGEVLQKAVEHARAKHGVDLSKSQTLMRYLQSLIREA
jgi:predicted small metal-binding protein